MDWAEKIVLTGTNPRAHSCFIVVGGSLAPLFVKCVQTVKLKPMSNLLT